MRLTRLTLTIAFAVAAIVAAASAQTGGLGPPPFPNAMNDGCQRSNAGLVTDRTPSWVYVNRDPTPKFATGVVTDTHLSHGDLNLNHQTYDFNSDVAVDAPYTNLLAGDPAKRTGNYQPTTSKEEADRPGHLHVEREYGSYPYFAWPHNGDRVGIWGALIWDCAHWSPGAFSVATDPGQPGEQTEIHPIRGIVVTRKDGALAKSGETQADVFISSNGTTAHAEEKCALSHAPKDSQYYDDGFAPCKSDPANRVDPPNGTDYTFFIPAPAHKPSGATLKFKVMKRQADNSPAPQVAAKTSPAGIQVTIPFKSAGGSPTGSFARTFLVSWSKPPSHKPEHLAVKIESYKSLKALDPNTGNPTVVSKPPDEDVATLDVNGVWQLLDSWAPKLLTISKGQTVKIGKTIKVYTAKGLSINMSGFECDSSGVLPPCPVRPGETGLGNDDLGEKNQKLSLKRSPGRHTIKSPLGTYLLTYSVTKIR
jgi:hypothetical protein